MIRPRVAYLRRAATVLAGLAALTLPVTAAGADTAQPASPAPRVAMVLLDVNTSTGAAGIAAERSAALGYAGALPADVRVGLIAFSDQSRVVLAPTTDRGQFGTAVAATAASGASSSGLYGGISAALSTIDSFGARAAGRLLVLSDGEYLGASGPVPAVPTDVMAWYYESDDGISALRVLASASGGRVAGPGDAATLAAAFPVLPPVTVTTPAPAPTTVPHAVRGPAVQAPQAVQHWRWSWGLGALLGGVFVVLLLGLLLVIYLAGQDERGSRVAARVGRYDLRRQPGQATGQPVEGAAARAAMDWTTRFLRSGRVDQRLAERLDQAGISRKPAEWVVLTVCVCVALAATLAVLIGNVLLGVALGALVGWLGMHVVVSVLIRRRRAAFGEQLPDVLQLIAGSLRSGFSLPQALDAMVREETQPVAAEFSRALAETRIGVELEAALDRVANRMESTDLRWIVMAIRIQRTVGGNLAEVLHNIVQTMRERAQLRRHVRALSAEGRISAYILIALPLLTGAWLFYSKPSYMRPLYTTSIGLTMLAGAAVLMAVGVLWMRKMIRVEV